MKRFFFWVVYLFIIVVVFFVVGEVCFRVFRGAPNPLFEVTQHEKEYLFEPDKVIQGKSSIDGEFDVTAHINAEGYRGGNFITPKPAGEFRVFVIGDSYTFGVGAQDSETIPSRIEQGLRAQGYQQIRVVNAGVGHTGPVKHYMNVRDIHLKHQPDMVLLLLDLTDLSDDWYAETHGIFNAGGDIVRVDPVYKNGKRDWWLVSVQHSAFCRYLHDKLVRTLIKVKHLGFKNYLKAKKDDQRAKAVIINSPDISDEVKIEYDGMLFLRGRPQEKMIRQHWQRTARYIAKIRDLLAQQNIPMVLVMYPHGIYVGPEEWNDGRATWGFEQHKKYTDYLPFEIASEWAAQEGIPFVNTLDWFLTAPSGQKYFYDWDGHMTPAGYKLVSDGILGSHGFRQRLKETVESKGKTGSVE